MERLAHLIKEEVNLHLESKKEVENLTGKLKKIHEVLNDAERIGVTDSQLKNRLKELEDVSYEMEDALDEWKTVNHQLQNEGSEEISDLWEKDMKPIPQGPERLTGLWTLSGFKAVRGLSKLRYLKDLNELRGSLKLFLGDLTESKDFMDAEKAELKNKIYIKDLSISFDGEVRVDIMEALQPPPNLHSFQMYDYKGTQLPEWITTSLNYLRVLRIESFKNCSSLPPLGKLPMLEELKISFMDSMKYVGNEFLWIMETIQILPSVETAFPKLRRLSFSDCSNWESWRI